MSTEQESQNNEGKHSLLKTVYLNEPNLLEKVRAGLLAGADPNERTEYFETPLRVASRNGRFDVVKTLFEAGADPSHLNWTPLFHAVACGELSDVQSCINSGSDLHTRDTWDRTPILVAVLAGDITKVKCLIDSGASIFGVGRCESPATEYAIQMDDAEMLSFLIQEQGIDIEKFNLFGYTPLMEAAEKQASNCVHWFVENGVTFTPSKY